MKVNYAKVALLPALVRAFCYSHEAWIVGSSAAYLLDTGVDYPRDWDVLVPFWHWGVACKMIPKNSPTNSHGGIKIDSAHSQIDVWAGDIGWFLAQLPTMPGYAVQPKSMAHLVVSRDFHHDKGVSPLV